ncbi:hypothetical protein [Streptomyces sclerotialus]|uniref:hypothetical protein n=1 Tax=Streptomyces sclerotialus TaxID=1957 RepID=UPI0004C60281
MAITDDIVKKVTDPTPLYALAGTADLASEKLKEVPALVERLRTEAPKRFEEVRTTDAKAVQDRVSKQAKEAQDKFYELLGSLDTDLKKIREQAQDIALQSVGRAAEYAVKAGDTYKELAERGHRAVQTWRGEVAEEVEELAVAIEPETEPKAKEEPKAAGTRSEPGKAGETKSATGKTAAETKPASTSSSASTSASSSASTSNSASNSTSAKKTTPPAARKTTTAKKTTPPSK